MKRAIFFLLLIGGQFSYAAYIVEQTPPKLEAFIKKNIGLENFFDGKNINSNEIVVKKTKDFTYFSFYIYKSVSMSIGVVFDKNNKLHHLQLGKQKYALTLALEEDTNPSTGLKNSTVIFLFKRD